MTLVIGMLTRLCRNLPCYANIGVPLVYDPCKPISFDLRAGCSSGDVVSIQT